MGTSPAKMFNPPTPFGASPQSNNVSQAQPLAQNQGPGFAAMSGFDQTQQAPQTPAPPSPFSTGGKPNRIDWMSGNPFRGMLQQ